ncbi:OmpA family protein [Oceanihabitans sediminis]|uniref:OmpA family protein n=1 Tax=Oceanihabitans sediminis TaxID=1812012 RepID=A0A368P9A1_9FLAO|nr:OmpA family protein [Oceanihabitans sediminis]MDX1277365.1 OmpA family protein [Oceanihabitans sediminis]MDX1773025.1 OmpA family protein [Oceanihabitans sediminis]RBP34718.1 OmpA family protein [Oceanihabitans sediminis]RCU58369.1 OmpA family protein [Oceanihabitans sediminis]
MNKINLYLFLFLCSFSLLAQEKLTHEVYFETDDFQVLSTEENRLLLFISQLAEMDIDKISIYGFCDDRGSENYNLTLSQNRANAIKTIFSNNEIDESLISNVDGKGKVLLKIIKEDQIDKIRGLNRKVEIIVTKKKKEVVVEKPKEEVKQRAKNEKTTEDISSGNIVAGDKIRLKNIYFKTGYAELAKESKSTLDEIANILVEHDNIYFSVEGHVCCTQNSRDAVNRKTNQRNLSLARAKFIYDYLLKKGVNKRRMRYIGMRRKFPLGGDPKYDRRVEILITHVAKKR